MSHLPRLQGPGSLLGTIPPGAGATRNVHVAHGKSPRRTYNYQEKGEGSSKGVSPPGLGAATAGPSASWDEAWDRLQGKERLREGAVRIKRTVAAEATPSTPRGPFSGVEDGHWVPMGAHNPCIKALGATLRTPAEPDGQ